MLALAAAEESCSENNHLPLLTLPLVSLIILHLLEWASWGNCPAAEKPCSTNGAAFVFANLFSISPQNVRCAGASWLLCHTIRCASLSMSGLPVDKWRRRSQPSAGICVSDLSQGLCQALPLLLPRDACRIADAPHPAVQCLPNTIQSCSSNDDRPLAHPVISRDRSEV